MRKDEIIGSYEEEDLENGIPEKIQRGWSGEGWVYKSYPAFERGEEVCYIPENSNYGYVREDFLNLSLGQEDIAEEMFASCRWQDPGTWIENQFTSGELAACPVCGKIYQSYDRENCPICGGRKNEI